MVRGVEEQKLQEGGALLLALAGRGQTWKYGGKK
jgi:3-oxoacyl-[acyl-carrier-protein] synthase III